MRKNLLLFMMIISSSLCFSNHSLKYEDWEKRRWSIFRDHTPGDTIVSGDQKYWYMVGGIYKNKNITGVVYYINEELGIMKICEPRSSDTYHDEYGNCEAPYNILYEAYSKNGMWNIFTIQEIKIYAKNLHLIHYNRTWEDNPKCITLCYSGYYWTRSKDNNGLTYIYNVGRDVTKTIPLYNSEVGNYYGASARGTIDVPFDLSLISEYELP